MCKRNNVLDDASQLDDFVPKPIGDFFLIGIKKMKEMFLKKGNALNKLQTLEHVTWKNTSKNHLDKSSNDSDVSSDGDEEPDKNQ